MILMISADVGFDFCVMFLVPSCYFSFSVCNNTKEEECPLKRDDVVCSKYQIWNYTGPYPGTNGCCPNFECGMYYCLLKTVPKRRTIGFLF